MGEAEMDADRRPDRRGARRARGRRGRRRRARPRARALPAASRSTTSCRPEAGRARPPAPRRPLRMTDWTLESWRAKPAEQQPAYRDPAALAARGRRSSRRCRRWSPAGRSRRSSSSWPRPRAASAFLLQGGDCAETLRRLPAPTAIANKLKILLQMSLVLVYGCAAAGDPRRAASPASTPSRARPTSKTRDGVTLPSLPRRPDQPRRLHRRGPHARSRSCCCAATSARR